MPNIKEYQIISAIGTAQLRNDINKAIQDGWQPLGGVSSLTILNPKTGKGEIHFFQAAVKYEG